MGFGGVVQKDILYNVHNGARGVIYKGGKTRNLVFLNERILRSTHMCIYFYKRMFDRMIP